MNEQKQISCPSCKYEYPYHDGHRWVCADCGHQWDPLDSSQDDEYSDENSPAQEQFIAVKDANGNILQDGDSVSIIKDLKVKGASNSLKVGTKVKSIRLVPEASDGHNISCNIPGFGAMNLKSEFVKKI